jgi:hypothetical protein
LNLIHLHGDDEDITPLPLASWCCLCYIRIELVSTKYIFRKEMDLSQMWLDKIRTKSVCLKHIGKSLGVYKKGKEDAPKFWDNVNDKTNH